MSHEHSGESTRVPPCDIRTASVLKQEHGTVFVLGYRQKASPSSVGYSGLASRGSGWRTPRFLSACLSPCVSSTEMQVSWKIAAPAAGWASHWGEHKQEIQDPAGGGVFLLSPALHPGTLINLEFVAWEKKEASDFINICKNKFNKASSNSILR